LAKNERTKILIIKLSSLGDVIQTLPVLIPLRKKFPDAKISWVVEEEAAEIIKDHPLVDQLVQLLGILEQLAIIQHEVPRQI
jgi:ADP-heptose:LPS heptosyltransferase